MSGLDSTNCDLRLLIEGLEMSIGETSNSTTPAEERLCYNLDWKPDIDLLDRVQTLRYCQEKYLIFQSQSNPIEI